MPGFVDALRIKWPYISARADETFLVTIGETSDGTAPTTAADITTPFDFTGWENPYGAVNGTEGTTTTSPAAFNIEARIYGSAPNGQLLVTIPRSVSGGLQDRGIYKGHLDVFLSNSATGERKKFVEGVWLLDLSTTQDFSN